MVAWHRLGYLDLPAAAAVARSAALTSGEFAQQLSDYARNLVPEYGKEHMKPGEFIIQGRRGQSSS